MNSEKLKKIEINYKTYTIYGTVRGLALEENEIDHIFEQDSFDTVLLGISPEDLDGLKLYIEKPFDVDLSDYEIIYGLKLQRYGKVKMPVPSFYRALKIAMDKKINVIAIDMNEMEYGDAYTRNIKFADLMRHTLRKNRMYRKEFKAATPEEFALKWDREIRKIKGYSKLERERESYIADKIKNNNQGKNILVIVDYERMDGIIKNIKGESDEK